MIRLFIFLPLLIASCSLTAGKYVEVNPINNTIVKAGKDPQHYKFVKHQEPTFLNYQQLTKLAANPHLKSSHLDRLWTQPLINNTHYFEDGYPKPQSSKQLGHLLRVATWNIEKSLNVPEIVDALQSKEAYLRSLKKNLSSEKVSLALKQRERLKSADILILQEVDIGHHRSGYRNNAEYIAKKLNMNYAYGVTQLEISPEYLTGSTSTSPQHRNKYKGMFGIAVLSKYPIKRVKLKQLEAQIYNWYDQESEPPDLLEKGRRLTSSLLFNHKHKPELKLGGRSFMRVDLHIPGLPHESLSVVNTHLEIKATPQKRRQQAKEILNYIKHIKNPVILAGDFNSSPIDVSPTSAPKALKKISNSPSNLTSLALTFASLTGLSQAKNSLTYLKNYRDPLANHIFALSPNHQHSMFRMIRDFRFEDGGAFDFRGNKKGSLKRVGVLSNSNQRKGKGFEFTFKVPRPIGPFGHEKLDWFFVKSLLTESNEKNGSRRLAPHFGETLNAFNRGPRVNFSDHSPMMIDLPLHQIHLSLR